ncbi:MAG: ATPase, partial [Thiotrichales bacterium]
YFKNNPKLLLILSGSVSSWIEKNILASTGFLGRISIDLLLEELPLHECTAFWGKYKQHTAAYDMLQIFSITGGVPRYLEEIYTEQSASNNIQRLGFSKNGFLFKEFDKIFSDLFDVRSEKYKVIVRKLAYGHATLDEIYTTLDTEKTGVVTNYVADLIAAGFISRDFTWNIKDGKDSKLSVLRLKDNYLRFYLRYIEPNKERIARDTIGVPQQLSSILGLQFENLVLANRKAIYNLLSLNPNNIIVDNPFFQRKTKRQQGCQIDYMIQTSDSMLYLCEIKFSKDKLGLQVMHEMQEKLARLSVPKHFSKRAVLIHVNGITTDLAEAEFFTKIISFEDLLT